MTNIQLNHIQQRKTNSVSLISGTRQGYLFSPLLFNTVHKVLITAIRQQVKGTQNEEEEVKLTFTDNMILYIEIPKDSTKKLLELINELHSRKQNIQKSVAFLYTNDELS